MSDTLAEVFGGGDVIEIRCTRDRCPQPVIGQYLADVYAAHGSEPDEQEHEFRVHVLPRREKDVMRQVNGFLSQFGVKLVRE